jgi:glycosyltransferase involved in cell wall biosynthesis
MSTYPLVSIVVSTYNQGRYLPIALDSVMFQSYPNIEIIICNFGSTDNTSQIVQSYVNTDVHDEVSYLSRFDEDNPNAVHLRKHEKRFPFNREIKILEGHANIGGTNSYNRGFKAAVGKYCTYLVADDYFLPEAISVMVEAMERTAADVVYSDLFVVDDVGRILQLLRKPDYSFKACFADWFHLGVSRLYLRELHRSSGYYDPEYKNANDYDMFLRFAMDGARFHHIPRVLYCTRKHDPNNKAEPASWRGNGYENLIQESTTCARRARGYLAERKGDD